MKRAEILSLPCTFIPPAKFSSKGFPLENKPLSEILVGRLQRYPRYVELIEKCRDEARRGDPSTESGKTTKKQLPTWLPGIWTGKARKEDLLQFGGVMFFDIDQADNPGLSVETMKALVSKIPSVAVAATSVRGQGIYGLVEVPADAEDEQRLEAYYTAFGAVLNGIGLRGDGKCKNLNRQRYLSLDKNPYIAEECKVFTEWLAPPEKAPRLASRPVADKRNYDGNPDKLLRGIEKMAQQCESTGIDPFPTGKDWFQLARALTSRLVPGDAGRRAFKMFSNAWERSTGRKQGKNPDVFFDEVAAMPGRWDTPYWVFIRCEEYGIYAFRETKNRETM